MTLDAENIAIEYTPCAPWCGGAPIVKEGGSMTKLEAIREAVRRTKDQAPEHSDALKHMEYLISLVEELEARLTATRGQWVHSVHREACEAALARLAEPAEGDEI